MGFKTMPWQDLVLDVALEYDPDTGKFVYSTVIVTVPRQSGKTLLLLIVILLRMVGTFGRQQVIYTAQRLSDAVEKFEEDWVPILRSPSCVFREKKDFWIRLANGKERLKWRNNSTLRFSATTRTSGHSKTLDLVMIDEAFAHEDDRVDAGFGPPMATRAKIPPSAQKWINSTAGDHRSHYLNDKRGLGRKLAAAGDTESGIAYFEWSAPEDCDTYDRQVWRDCMPALGITVDESFVAKEAAEMDEDEFRRAYLNITKPPPSAGGGSALDVEQWYKQADRSAGPEGRLVVALAMPKNRSKASISVAGRRAEGDLCGEHVASRPGTSWVVDFLKEMVAKWPDIAGIAVDMGGPASSEGGEIEAAGLPLIKMNAGKYAAACGLLHDRVDEGRYWHRDQAELNAAVEVATKRPLGERWAFNAPDEDVDISTLKSLALATGAVAALPDEDEPETSVYSERGFVDW